MPETTTKSPKISALLPIFNAAQSLPHTLDSLQRQRFANFEIIAIDDGSTDDTSLILKTRAQKDSRITVLSPGKVGLVNALNMGIHHAQAPFLARMDADDVSHPNRLGDQFTFLQNHPEIAVVSSLVQCFPRPHIAQGFRQYENWLNSLRTPAHMARDIFVESPLVHPSVLMRREAIEKVQGYQDHGWAEDYDLWLRLHLSGGTFAKIPRILHYWRESPHRLTRQDKRYTARNFLQAKAHYLSQGPLANTPNIIIWGAGQLGTRLAKLLFQKGVSPVAFVDVASNKIGKTRQNIPIIAPNDLKKMWQNHHQPIILSAVPSWGARQHIRQFLNKRGFIETKHYICVA